MNSRRTAGETSLKMERAYIDAENGKSICCWEAPSREVMVDLFERAGVTFEAMAPVAEVLEVDFK